jgi:hypothetical protein
MFDDDDDIYTYPASNGLSQEMSVALASTSEQFVQCGEKIKKVLTLTTVVTRNAKKNMMEPKVGPGGVCVWWESGVRRSIL